MKTINLELSKRLTPYLENIDNEYCYIDDVIYHLKEYKRDIGNLNEFKKELKTLTIEKSIEFIAKETDGFIFTYHKSKIIKNEYYYTFMERLKNGNIGSCIVANDTLLGAIERMLEYLLDNNLINK